ncbi:MAG: molybdate ABC transporter substrate-binding protein [Thermoguttaceae bacterium]
MKRSVATNLAGLILLLGGLAGCGGKTAAKPHDAVLVFAAASTTNAMDDIKSRFEQESGIDVHANYAASSTLAQQIVHGADADIFLSADIQWADRVAAEAAAGQRRNLLGNRLVIIVPADSTLKIQDPRDLAAGAVQHLAVGDPASVPIGKYARRALERLAIWDQLKSKIVAGADVRQALAYVETGAAEAGIIYATDAAISKKVKVACDIPEKLTGPVRYPLVLLKHGAGRRSAESFYRWLASSEAAKVFEKHGFVVLQGEPRAKP